MKWYKQGIITPITESTEWVNSITYPVKLSGQLYKAATLEEIPNKLIGTRKFSKLDAYKGFFAYHLDKESSRKSTFSITPWCGKFHFPKIPMGTKFSQEAYQMKMDQILEGLDGVVALLDDITIYGKDDADHEKTW